MAYIDGAVVAVPTAKKADYLKHSKKMATLFRKHGAIQVIEAWGDEVPEGKLTSFPKAVKCKEDETVVLSWIWWPSKAVHDKGWEKCMKEMETMTEQPPFDGKRMIFGGFKIAMEA